VVKKNKKDERFKEFLVEAEDILSSMGRDLLKLGKGVKAGLIDPSVLNSIFRSAHTLKGISGIYDFKDMAVLSHSLEDTLDMLRLDRVTLSDELLGHVMDAHEMLVGIIASKGAGDFTIPVQELKASLVGSCQAKKSKDDLDIDKKILATLTEYEAHRLRDNLKQSKNILIVAVRFPIINFDKGYASLIDALKTGAEVIATLPSSESVPEMLSFDILIGTLETDTGIKALASKIAAVEVRRIAGPMTESAPGAIKGVEPLTAPAAFETLRRVSDSVRVDIEKLDNIMNIVSELGMLKSSVARLSAEMKNDTRLSFYGIELSRIETYLERKFTELRDSVLDIRMVPIGQLFSRFETFITKLARETGKEIRLETRGDDTEIDKLIVEELADPLMHIIRNIVDHALEHPAERERVGKERYGTIALKAFQSGNHVVIEVIDDGIGIDEVVIKKKALEKGLVSSEDATSLTRHQILELIFMPGFTTRDSVSATSGRGVGMDVVKENIARLSGIVDIETVKGEGTKFSLTIPITLAIVQALIVEELGVRYAIPLSSVIEIAELHSSTVAENQEYVRFNDRDILYIRLGEFFYRKETEAALVKETCYGIVVGLAEQRLCIIVDRLLEELDVVVKPLPTVLRVGGIAGAADVGDEGTMLVADVTGILELLPEGRKAYISSKEAV
jgi:two-component system chemotaxis sensor kinase CheA